MPHCAPCSSSGMTVLQCVSVTLKSSMRGGEGDQTWSQSRLDALRQEQMMETLECLLQMTTIGPAMTRRPSHVTRTTVLIFAAGSPPPFHFEELVCGL